MNKVFSLVCSGPPAVCLRAIGQADLEELRVWKNANRRAFFFQGEITAAMQQEWYQGYLARPQDYMFLVAAEGLRAGCMGFRILAGAADCYNIIGTPAVASRGIMAAAMRLMCSFILAEHNRAIGLRVLKDNPAVGWYQQKCAYHMAGEGPDYFQLELDLGRFVPCSYQKQEARP